jgi:hypothetical protein
MFGYIRPLKDELKVREFEQFKACYCGLCRALKKDYGQFARFLLTYDFTFLAMLLWDGREDPKIASARCPASPVRRKTVCVPSPVLARCAGYSVILSWWKLKDTVDDEGFFTSLKDRLLLLFFKRHYKKASRLYPDFKEAVSENLSALRLLEGRPGATMDACADRFARITRAMAADVTRPEIRRPLEQLLYHTGRFIYLLDALDDLSGDMAKGRFNPLVGRFNPVDGRLSEKDGAALKETLEHSGRLIGAAFELLPVGAWTEILKNIIYLGMPQALNRVFAGTGEGNRRRRRAKH